MEYEGKAAFFVEGPFVAGGLYNFFPDFNLDYAKLVNYLERKFKIRIHTKTIYIPKPDKDNPAAFKFRDSLSYLGFSVDCDKEPFYYKDPNKPGEIVKKCNFDSQISIEMLEMVLLGKAGIDYIILFASDIDYFDILKKLHVLGIHTIVLGFKNTHAAIKNIADNFVLVDSIQNEIMTQKNVFKENGKKVVMLDKEEKKSKIVDKYSEWYK